MVASKFEGLCDSSFLVIWFSVKWPPLTSVNSFVVIDSESQQDRCWLVNPKSFSFSTH